jgi:DNA transformation protein
LRRKRMPVSEHYIEFIHDLLADFEPLRIKRMFGGAGVYSGDLFFAILVEDTLYLKVDDGNRAAYQDRGIQPFSYEGRNGRRATMSYYPVPPELLDDPDALGPWARQAIDAARRAAVQQAKSGRKAPGSAWP